MYTSLENNRIVSIITKYKNVNRKKRKINRVSIIRSTKMHGWQYHGRISIRCTCFSSTNRHRRGAKGERSRRRVGSRIYFRGALTQRERERERAQHRGKRRIYVFGEGQGNEGSDKCTGVVQLDATGGGGGAKETRFPVYKLIFLSPREQEKSISLSHLELKIRA